MEEQKANSEEQQRQANYTENSLAEHEAAEASSTGQSGVKKFLIFTGIVIAAFLIIGFYLFGGSSAEKDKKTTLSVSSTPAANTSNAELESQLRDLKTQLNGNTNPANPAATPNGVNPANPNAIMNEPLQMPQTVADQPIYNVNPLATPTPSGSQSNNNGGGGGNTTNERPSSETTKNSNVSSENRLKNEQNPSFPLTNPRSSGGPNPQKSVYLENPSENSNKSNSNVRMISPTSFVQNSLQKPPFNTVLPVRFLGAAHSLATSAMVRMELVRAIRGNGYYLPRGTILVGQISGNQYNRLFVSVNGYIDSATNQLISLRGDLLGDDGAVGVIGDKKRINSRWRNVLGKVLDGAKQLGSSYLLGRRGGSGGIGFGQIGQSGITALDSQNNAEFVMVRAGSFGYILVNDLPPLKSVESAPVEDESLLGSINGQKPVTNEEMVSLLTQGDETAVRREYPRMSPSMRVLADKMLAER